MSKFIEFNNTLINIEYITCVFPNEINDWMLEEGEDKYMITMRLNNNATFEEFYALKEERDRAYDKLKIKLLYDE
jgi:hypothetical protein